MPYTTNQFCWFEVNSTNKESAQDFYAKVLPWKMVTADMGPAGLYTMFCSPTDTQWGGFRQCPEGVPSHWNAYLRVDDVAASEAASATHGGTTIMAPTDIGVGTMAVVQSPSGAVFSLFHEADEAGSKDKPKEPGQINWSELHSTDVAADKAWLVSTFGFEVGEMPMPQGGTYTLLKVDGAMAAGLMPSMNAEAPSFWLSWVQVEDADAVVATAAEHGGQVLMPPSDYPGVGRMAMLQDPTGGLFGVLQPAG